MSSESSNPGPNQGVNLPTSRPGKPGGKRDQNRKERIRVLQEAALLLFLEQGLAATTIDEITKTAGTAKGNFYRYFSDKEDLVRAIVKPVAQKVEHDLTRAVEAVEKVGLKWEDFVLTDNTCKPRESKLEEFEQDLFFVEARAGATLQVQGDRIIKEVEKDVKILEKEVEKDVLAVEQEVEKDVKAIEQEVEKDVKGIFGFAFGKK